MRKLVAFNDVSLDGYFERPAEQGARRRSARQRGGRRTMDPISTRLDNLESCPNRRIARGRRVIHNGDALDANRDRSPQSSKGNCMA